MENHSSSLSVVWMLVISLLLLAISKGAEPGKIKGDPALTKTMLTAMGTQWVPDEAAAKTGWWKHVNDKGDVWILRTTNEGKSWLDVSPAAMTRVVKAQATDVQGAEFLEELVELHALDEKRAWVAFAQKDNSSVVLEYTADGGSHWQQAIAPVKPGYIHIDFLDERRGFLLNMGGKGVGPHAKSVYGTVDGGKHWAKLGSPAGRSFIPSGITFRNPLEGWITGTYRGDDYYPLYHTADGGKTWQAQNFPVPADYLGGYGNTEPPVFAGKDKKKGRMRVDLVRHEPPPDHSAEVEYKTEDGGGTWVLPAEGVPSTRR